MDVVQTFLRQWNLSLHAKIKFRHTYSKKKMVIPHTFITIDLCLYNLIFPNYFEFNVFQHNSQVDVIYTDLKRPLTQLITLYL